MLTRRLQCIAVDNRNLKAVAGEIHFVLHYVTDTRKLAASRNEAALLDAGRAACRHRLPEVFAG